ncbi:MAG: translation elongation factor-like protein [Candidatus Nanoarchaeia archaeon]|nr:translation elongation factor-like protein [Candidatus Nanoarchaeia archaeon]
MEKEIGKVEDYFSKIGVIAITLSGSLKIGDKIKVKGATTEFEQVVESMQIDRKPVKAARAGDSVGIKVKDLARKTDKIYKIS